MTDLSNTWGTIIKSFTVGDPLSLAYVTSPKNTGVGVPTSVRVYSRVVPGATSYIIELNTAPDFSGISQVKTASTNNMVFSGLSNSTTYFTRVQTDLMPGQWGSTVTHFSTINPAARTSGDWVGEEDEEVVVIEPFALKIFGNPFHERLTFLIETPGQENVVVGLFDSTGKSVHQSSEKTNSMIEIETPLSQGIYILQVRTNTDTKAIRVMKED